MTAQSDHSERPIDPTSHRRISVTVPAGGYFSTAFVGAFFASFAFYSDLPSVGALLLFVSVAVVPALAWSDRVVFNGKRVYRSGFIARAWAYLTGTRFWLKPGDIEQVESSFSATFRRGGRVHLRYETSIRGKGFDLFLNSSSRNYWELVTNLFARLPEEVLDSVSLELRDHAGEPGAARAKAKLSRIPSSDVLEHSFRTAFIKSPRKRKGVADARDKDSEAAEVLHKLGNELRVSGSFMQALESFRRAAVIAPDNARLLLDFAQCMQSFAGVNGDRRLERRASAMLRLAERRAGNDGRLLSRLGEAYSQSGDLDRARGAFEKAMAAAGDQFRSICGMAELALRDGKMAHVVHNLRSAGGFARTRAARRWSEAEAEYFSRLSTDEEYLEVELGRVNLLDALRRWERTTLKLGIAGLPIIGLGIYYSEPTTTNCGWILSAGMLTLWTVIRVGRRLFARRISPELLEE